MLAERMEEWLEEDRQRVEAGREEGRLEALRDMAIRLLQKRFLTLSESIADEIRAMTDGERLTELAENVFVVDSIDDLGLGGSGSP